MYTVPAFALSLPSLCQSRNSKKSGCIYVCICVCMYVCVLMIPSNLHDHMYVCMYMYVCIYVCMYAYVCVCAHDSKQSA